MAVYLGTDIQDSLRLFVGKSEFRAEIEAPVLLTGYTAVNRFIGEPSQRFVEWAVETLPVTRSTAGAIERSQDWRDLLIAVWSDLTFQKLFDDGSFPALRRAEFLAGLQSPTFDHSRSLGSNPFTAMTLVEDHAALFAVSGHTSPRAAEPVDTINMLTHLKKMNRVVKRQSAFHGVQNDPQLIFRSLDPGRYHVRAHLSFAQDMSSLGSEYAQFFFDLGAGYQEAHSIRLPVRQRAVTSDVLIELSKPARELRLDPSVGPSKFTVEYITLTNLGQVSRRHR